MYSINFIRNILKKYIQNKIDKFIIYPFGANGMNVKNVLKDCFELEPDFIVDNEYSKYNSEIITKEELKKVYQKDMYIILTIEDYSKNTEIMNELSTFVPFPNLINLLQENNKTVGGVNSKGFLIRDFLPMPKQDAGIKVRIVSSVPTIWNSISTMCQAFKEDPLFDILIIGLKGGVEHVKRYGYKYIVWDEYRIEDDEPDILILTNAYDRILNPDNCRKYAKVIFAVSGTVIKYDASIDKYWEEIRAGYGICNPDYYLFDSYLYNEILQSDYYSEKIIEMGNAKFDGIYNAMKKKDYISGWEKLKGKTTVLWAEGHGVSTLYEQMRQVTFDLYAKTIFEYANNNPEMGIIFRPHRGFILDMLRNGFWNENDLEYLKEYCGDSPNIVFDDTETYENAFSIVDGILVSAYCGIIYSALPTLKPICACYRSKEDLPCDPIILDNYYAAYDSKDIVDFLNMVKNEQDPMFALRSGICKKYIKYFDGKNGWRTKEFIKNKYCEKYEVC